MNGPPLVTDMDALFAALAEDLEYERSVTAQEMRREVVLDDDFDIDMPDEDEPAEDMG